MALLDDTRADWDARPPLWDGFPHVAPSKRAGRMWHWNGPPVNIGGRDHSACLAAVRADQAFHQNTRRWSDVGYNALICPHGRAVEGAGIDKAAAHCKGYNTSHYGIQLMVGQGEHPTPAMLARAVQLSSDLTARSGHHLEDLGHRDGFATACPGDEIYAWVRNGGPTTAGKDWLDMATLDELRAVIRAEIRDDDFLREVARYVATGYPIGPPGDAQVLGGWALRAAKASEAGVQLAAGALKAEDVAAIVDRAIADGVQVTGDLKVSAKGAGQ